MTDLARPGPSLWTFLCRVPVALAAAAFLALVALTLLPLGLEPVDEMPPLDDDGRVESGATTPHSPPGDLLAMASPPSVPPPGLIGRVRTEDQEARLEPPQAEPLSSRAPPAR